MRIFLAGASGVIGVRLIRWPTCPTRVSGLLSSPPATTGSGQKARAKVTIW